MNPGNVKRGEKLWEDPERAAKMRAGARKGGKNNLTAADEALRQLRVRRALERKREAISKTLDLE